MIECGREICTDIERSGRLEWLETNGIGGFAAGTVAGINTRRYHGALIAATRPPLGRVLLLSKFEETLVIGDEEFELSANRYPDAVHPEGFRHIKSFALKPFPVWTFEVNGIEIEKKLFMPHGQNAIVLRWEIKNKSKIQNLKPKIQIRPLVAFRDHHHLRREEGNFDHGFEVSEELVTLRPTAVMPALYFSHNAGGTERTGYWYKNFEYAIEEERGFDFREDLFQPFELKFDLPAPAVVIISSDAPAKVSDAEELEKREIKRRAELIKTAGAKDDLTKQIVLAADQFIVRRGEGHTIIAGYPWFSDWGRDTMISLAGLTLATNRPEIAKNILREFSNHLSKGMLPNRFPDEGEEPEYNTVDATLWYFEAIRAYAEKTSDYEFVREELYEKLKETIGWHRKGTRYGIRVGADGLLAAGEAGVQLTWMDAKIGDWVVTPRTGKPVEIQALWYNALKIMEELAGRFEDEAGRKEFAKSAAAAKKSFNREFWNTDGEYLFDVVGEDEKDASLRPNQVYAVSLPHSMLDKTKAGKILKKIEAQLLTPFGLRSLAPSDERYRPVYHGNPPERDSAYHQGTVWAFLTGAYLDACRKFMPDSERTKKHINEVLEGLTAHFSDAGLGQISEVFDADEPHRPGGCFAQAWSVGETLRQLIADN